MIGVGDIRSGAAAVAFRLVVKLSPADDTNTCWLVVKLNSSRTRLDKALAVTPHPLPAD